MKTLKRTLAFSKRNLIETARDPLSLIFTLALPLVLLVGFYYLFSGLTSQFDMQYLAPGIVCFGASFIALSTGLLIAIDKSTSFLVRLYTTPLKSGEFILGYALPMLPVGLLQAVLFFTVAVIIEPSFFSSRLILAILCSLVVTVFYIASGILFGSLCNDKSVGGLCSVLIMGQSVLSGMWFPVETLDEGFVSFMEALPFRNADILLQNAVSGSGGITKPLLILLGYTVTVFLLAIIAYGRKMKN